MQPLAFSRVRPFSSKQRVPGPSGVSRGVRSLCDIYSLFKSKSRKMCFKCVWPVVFAVSSFLHSSTQMENIKKKKKKSALLLLVSVTKLEAFHLWEHYSFSLETLRANRVKDGFYISFQGSQTFGCHHMCSATELPYHLFYAACIHSHILRERISFLIFHIKQISCEA